MADEAFVLQHTYEDENGNEETKLIGLYSTLEKANAVVERFKSLPGFQDYPDGFSVDHYRFNVDHWLEGFVHVK
jgi:homoserine kinase type II